MKKLILIIMTCFIMTGNYSSIVNENDNNSYNLLSFNIYEDSYKRDYDYLGYNNTENYNVTNKDDIKTSIYNGLNSGNGVFTLYCKYNNYNDCINDFYDIYDDGYLMESISNYVNPYNKYSSTRYRININNGVAKIELTIEKKYTKEEIEEINSVLNSYITKLDLNIMTVEQKIKWAHDFLVNKNIYDDSQNEESYSAYGAIVGGKATCQGYAEAMAIILDKFNIPNIMISNGIHIWNLVNVNGDWLHLDATWDDPITKDRKQKIIYDYYLVTSSELLKLDKTNNHSFNANYYLELI